MVQDLRRHFFSVWLADQTTEFPPEDLVEPRFEASRPVADVPQYSADLRIRESYVTTRLKSRLENAEQRLKTTLPVNGPSKDGDFGRGELQG